MTPAAAMRIRARRTPTRVFVAAAAAAAIAVLLLTPLPMAEAQGEVPTWPGAAEHRSVYSSASATTAAAASLPPSLTLSMISSASLAQERALREAVAKANYDRTTVNVTLTSDILLTRRLTDLESSLNIVGRCKDPSGKPRSCVIDGAAKYSLFRGRFNCEVRLQRLVIQNIFGNVVVGGCLMSARDVVFRHNVGPRGVILDHRENQPPFWERNPFFRCDFINNTALFEDGGVINAGNSPILGPIYTFTQCTFRRNRALAGKGGAIYAQGTSLTFRNVVFEGNSAESGGAISTSAQTLIAINTTFSSNTARYGRGGALEIAWDFRMGTVKFCRSTFRGNSASQSQYRSSSNMVFYIGDNRAKVGFCGGPVPDGIQAPKRLFLVQNCTGCTGCDGDCNGNGTCTIDQLYGYPACKCNNFYDRETSCTTCLTGYTPKSACVDCALAFYHPKSKPATCAICPGLNQVLQGSFLQNQISNVTAAPGPLACQRMCNATQAGFNITSEEKAPANSYCNFWAYIPPGPSTPAEECGGKCVMLYRGDECGVWELRRVPKYSITYQLIEPDLSRCPWNE